MPLTAHQIHHVNAMLSEVAELQAAPQAVLDDWATVKGININKVNKFLGKLNTYLQAILDNEIWPNVVDEEGNPLTDPAELHDYLEKRLTELRN